MLARIRNLSGYRKALLLFMVAELLVFAVVYPWVISREGIRYGDRFLLLRQEGETTVYEGEDVLVTLSGGTLTIREGDRVYGPYTLREEPSDREGVMGFALLRGEEVLLRGGVRGKAGNRWVTWEGKAVSLSALPLLTEGPEGEPGVSLLLDLLLGPALLHKGDAAAYFLALFLCILGTVSILYADELFRWQLRFRIADPEKAEPSAWELMGRYVSWTVTPLVALGVLLLGLFV